MKSEYDFSQGRRGAIEPIQSGKTRITISLDDDILEWFRSRVHAAGGGNYQILLNQALHEYIQHYPDLHSTEKESDSVLTNLADFIDEPQQKSLPIQSGLFKKLFWWEKLSFLSILVLIVSYVLFKTNNSIKLPDFILVVWVSITIILQGLWFLKILTRPYTTETILRYNLEKIRDEVLKEESIVKCLSKKPKESLRIAKAKIRDLIEDWQNTSEIANKVISIMFFLIFLGILVLSGIIWGFDTSVNLKETIFYVATTTIVTIFIKPIIESTGQLVERHKIRELKKCLLILEEAEAIAETIETNKNGTQSE
jgi:BrnA antitoxin of type II toxin-antitoxin system